MRGLVASALFSVLLLAASLRPGLPSQLVGQASAGEPDQLPPVERTQSPSALTALEAPGVSEKKGETNNPASAANRLPATKSLRLVSNDRDRTPSKQFCKPG